MAKYKLLTNDTITINGHKLFRIKALKDFNDVKKGDLGGYIESENNLSQDGTSWIYGIAKVYDKAVVYKNARIYNNAQIYDNAHIWDEVKIYDSVKIYGSAIIDNSVNIHNNAKIHGHAKIHGDTCVGGYAEICNSVEIGGNAKIKHPVMITHSRQVLTIDFVNSKNSTITFIYDLKSHIIYVSIDYFNGTLDSFISQIKNKCTNAVYAKIYLQTIEYVKTYFQTIFKETNKNNRRNVKNIGRYKST